MQDIHGIRPPVQVGVDPMVLKTLLMILAGLLVLAVLFFWVRKWLKKRQAPGEVKMLSQPLAPYEAAMNELELLLQQPMTDPRLFYFDLTCVLKKYIGKTFGIHAPEMTSQEFIRRINLLGLSRQVKTEIAAFQNLSDPFKYAGMAAGPDQVKQDIGLIKDVIFRIEKNLETRAGEET